MSPPEINLPEDGVTLAFVLRVRRASSEQSDRSVVDLEDVRTTKTWRFTSLEAAFDQIRLAVSVSGHTPESPAKPH